MQRVYAIVYDEHMLVYTTSVYNRTRIGGYLEVALCLPQTMDGATQATASPPKYTKKS